jgi:hypothetical protein
MPTNLIYLGLSFFRIWDQFQYTFEHQQKKPKMEKTLQLTLALNNVVKTIKHHPKVIKG